MSGCRTRRVSRRGSSHPRRQPSSCRGCASTTWPAPRGAARTGISTVRSRWWRRSPRAATFSASTCGRSKPQQAAGASRASTRTPSSSLPATETRALLAPLGIDLPLVAEDRYLFLSDPIEERLLEPLVVAPELAFAAKQLADGRVLASDLAARGDAESGRTRWRASIRAAIEQLLPRLEYVSFSQLVPGVYDVTPDHQPILGSVADGLFVACGFSGHGFMIAPAVARITADAVLGKRDEVLDVLGLDRFAAGRLVPEPQLV